jgi:hypothetical protein
MAGGRGRALLEEMHPWLETMFAVDEAERRGDAMEALRLMETRPVDLDGKPFWRPWRLKRLMQVVVLGESLPGWAVSRWVAAQAHETLGQPGDRRRHRSLQLALGVRGSTEGLSIHGPEDAMCKMVDHDWVYRQLFLYELGGLSAFVRSAATPDLLAGADHIQDWCRAPMSVLRLVGRTSQTVSWERVANGERVVTANIGSAALVVPEEHVLSRLVPIDGGVMLEGRPLVVPEAVGRRVASEPSSWLEVLAESSPKIETGGCEEGIVTDVRDLIWHFAMRDPADPLPRETEFDAYLARRTLALAERCLDDTSVWKRDAVDPWACLRAALLSPDVLIGLPDVARPGDSDLLARLAPLLAAPADELCRKVALELAQAA